MNRKQRLEEMAAAVRAKNLRRPGRPAYNAKPWTAGQIEWVKQNAPTMKRRLMAEHLGCCLSIVYRRIRELGLSYNEPRWTTEEDELLSSLAGTMPVAQIAARLGRGPDGVMQRASKALGLRLYYKRFWPEEADATLRGLAEQGKNTREISAEMNRSVGSIRERLRVLNLKAVKPARVARVAAPKPRVAKPKPPKAEKPTPAPRVREGLPVVINRRVIHGSVRYCDRCCAPVVDTPQAWTEHNLRVHVQPIRRIA